MPPTRSAVALLLAAVLCLGGVCRASSDFDYPAAFNFGDSNSDTGGRIAAGFEPMLPPYGSTFFGGPAGRFSDGRLILDFLMDAMDMPFLNSYLDSVGAPNFRAGVNFAQAGCSITPATATSVSPFSFGLQIKQFFAFKEKVTRLLSKGDRYRHFIPQLDYFSKGLYMFDIGQNDLAGAFYSKTEDQVIASIPTILLEFESGLKTLYEQGARKFWIHNTGPLGCLPQNIDLWGKDPTQLDEHHCVAKHNRAAKIFNLQLHALCTKLRGQFPGSDITYVDIYSVKYSLVANYSRYGFESPTEACCGYGGPPLNYDGRVPCGQTKSVNGNLVTAKGCSDSTEYVNWDGIHYTEAANFHVTSQILTGKYSDPPFSEKMPFLLKPRF
ncbi:GDSL esterase/lipase At1g54790 [Lolium perenne]|uniref:GDSL esterase/lipase At1g54790 n=1 Tax=Lolium perenne TaxID=4522 RepID=UPI0021EB47E7|nr:GDSL esterase/lipase At1g54790 [Lolium perenne]